MFKEQNTRVIPLTTKDYRIDILLGQTQSSMVVYKALTNSMNQICAIICAFVPNLAYYKTAEEYMQDCMKTVINMQEFANSSSVIKSITESYEFKSEEK